MTNLPLPDNLVKQIRETADAIGMTIPDLLSRLIDDYRQNPVAIRRHKPISRAGITVRLNTIYANQPSSLDPVLSRMQFRSLGHEQW